jgi:two-component SAPR family response regulator
LAALRAGYQNARHLLEDVLEDLRARETVLISGNGAHLSDAGKHARQASGEEPEVVLRCLGSFHIKVGDTTIDLGSAGKPLAIVKLLATRSRATPRDVLMETLWPESDPDTAANRLRVAVYELRRRLVRAGGDVGVVRYEHGCYVLNHGTNVRIDADDFDVFWRRGVRLEREGSHAEAIAHYREADELYAGDSWRMTCTRSGR